MQEKERMVEEDTFSFRIRASVAVKLSLVALIAADSGMFRTIIKDSQQTGQRAVRRDVCPF